MSKAEHSRSCGVSLGVFSSITNLDARPVPNAPIAIPNRGASGPVARRRYVHGIGRYVDGGRCVIAGAARSRGSKQCTNCQATNNAGGYLTTPGNRSPGCERQAACDQQTPEPIPRKNYRGCATGTPRARISN
jgi:hypothetical protein